MTPSLFLGIQQILMGSILALGSQLLIKPMPKNLKGSRVHYSTRTMGAAIIVIPIITFIYFLTGMREAGAQFAIATNISAYGLTSTLIATSYYILLEQIIDKIIIKIHIALGLIYITLLWIGLLLGSEGIARHTLIICYTLFCVLGVVHISTCIYFYRLRYNDYKAGLIDTDDVEYRLLSKTIHLSLGLLAISILIPSFIPYPLWIKLISSFAVIGGAINIFICYYKVLLNNNIRLKGVDEIYAEGKTIDGIVNATAPLNKDIAQNLEKQIQRWVKRKDFLRSDITMSQVAKATCTNRTYLSRYINTKYKYSFKSWITHLRIEEAKRLMQNFPELPISDIAKQTGFASVESFSHIFTRNEQLPPSRWRDRERWESNLAEPISDE